MSSGKTRVLVDAGRSARSICGMLHQIGEDMADINTVLITHEHRDHVQGLAVLARKYDFLIVMHRASYERMASELQGIPSRRIRLIEAGEYEHRDFRIRAFNLSHDAANTFGYTFFDGTAKIGIATDLGRVEQGVIANLSGCGLVAVDCNHDEQMVISGPYPGYLKVRILGDYGHLSNRTVGELLAALYQKGQLHQAVLAHLSKENNCPSLASESVTDIIKSYGIEVGKDLLLEVARRDDASGMHIA